MRFVIAWSGGGLTCHYIGYFQFAACTLGEWPSDNFPSAPKPDKLNSQDAFGVLIQTEHFIPLVGPNKLLICTFSLQPRKGDLVLVRFPDDTIKIGMTLNVLVDEKEGEERFNIEFIEKADVDKEDITANMPNPFRSRQFDQNWLLVSEDGDICQEPLQVMKDVAVVHTVRNYMF